MAATPSPAPTLEPGFRLDRYELLCRIGAGGMAAVWLARTANSAGEERLVAIKTILPGLAKDPTLRAMLLDEARIATAIAHPNVAVTLEVGQLWDMPYLVLEYVEGESIEQLCKALAEVSLNVPAAIVVRVVADAALGLHEAHELMGADGESLCIVHRDISPPNILIDEKGLARIIDFGVAKATERFTPETAAGVMKGRVPYMAPEHASGGAVDRRSDIWSLGAVAYFMLAGRYPFDGPNDAARLIRILGTDGPDPLPGSVAPAVTAVVLRALSKDPDDRFATAAELASALEVAKLPATHLEVAQFCRETLAPQQKARRGLIEHALAAADARAHARQLLDGSSSGSSVSYRPPAVAAAADPTTAAASGTLGTVTRSHRPPAKVWVPWLTATAVAIIVILAFALGSFSARAPDVMTVSGNIVDPSGTEAAAAKKVASPPTATLTATATTTPTARADVDASAKPTATADAARPADPKSSAPLYTWPPPPTTASSAPSAKAAPSAVKPASSKPVPEDTIY